MLSSIRIVLINTTHPGNIGSTARAMKTMGLSSLYLVNPLHFPHPKASELASGAQDVLDQTHVITSLEEAISDCGLVIGTSARARTIPWPHWTPDEAAKEIAQCPNTRVAILFGCEQSGLSNEELQRCHRHVTIPANPDYSSLNLAASVQVMTYEIRKAIHANLPKPTWDYPPANAYEMEKYFSHLEKVLIDIDFLKPSAPKQLMSRMRRLFLRARLDAMEVNMLRGMLGAIEELTSSIKRRFSSTDLSRNED